MTNHNQSLTMANRVNGVREKVFRRSLVPLPSPRFFNQVSNSKTLEDINEVSLNAVLAHLPGKAGMRRPLPEDCPRYLGELAHEFSTMAVGRSVKAEFEEDRTANEAALFEKIYPAFKLSVDLGDYNKFFDVLSGIGKQFTKSETPWRTGKIRLAEDSEGFTVQFPPSRLINLRLIELHAYLCRYARPYPVQVATVAMVALTNCHPFWDSNGRCSRILFNLVLRLGGVNIIGYVPLYEIFWFSSCGWEIRLRLTEITGSWVHTFSYIENMFLLLKTIAGCRSTEHETYQTFLT